MPSIPAPSLRVLVVETPSRRITVTRAVDGERERIWHDGRLVYDTGAAMGFARGGVVRGVVRGEG